MSLEVVFAPLNLNVSRETFSKLGQYEQLLVKWQKAINLVGPLTLEERKTRHFLDSAQLFSLIDNKGITLADLGSGAGFPGLVLAIMGIKNVHLIESDIRKATFLRNVSRETFCPVTVHDKRIEDCQIENIDIVTARALAPLTDLLQHVQSLKAERAIFLKGVNVQEEIEKAQKKWNFDVTIYNSVTDPEAKILDITNISRK